MATDQQDESSSWKESAKGFGLICLAVGGIVLIMDVSEQIGFGVLLVFMSIMFVIGTENGQF